MEEPGSSGMHQGSGTLVDKKGKSIYIGRFSVCLPQNVVIWNSLLEVVESDKLNWSRFYNEIEQLYGWVT